MGVRACRCTRGGAVVTAQARVLDWDHASRIGMTAGALLALGVDVQLGFDEEQHLTPFLVLDLGGTRVHLEVLP